MGMHIEVFVAP